METLCKKCNKLDYRIADNSKTYNGRIVYKNLEGKKWNGRHCPKCRSAQILELTKKAYIKKERPKKYNKPNRVTKQESPTYTKACNICNAQFTTKQAAKISCSKVCRARYRAKKYLYNNLASGKRLRRQRPKWANLKEIKEFYKNRPKGMHVDHIIPLRGENVSGLHVVENLQYLDPITNQKKYNKT